MIKLNNKNITYVALADSNNSLKAPKEIWYADSNNSVKLVYRRKDALIEGEDYEKYHWLKVEVNQKSTMMILPLSTSNFKYSIQLSGNLPNLSYFTTSWHTYGVNETQALVFVYDRKNSSRIYTCPTGFQLGEMINIESSTNELLFNGVSIPMYGYPAENFLIQTNNDIALNMKMTSLYVDGIERYIPVKLLKPVPKWLDANGIRRQAGECGMIDLVSGKFYGNVNSVGTFTVENYYERKEWLVGEINSAGTLQRLPINSSSMSYRVKRINGQNLHFFRTDGYDYYYRTENFHLGIYDLNQKTVIYNTSSIIDNEIDFECSAENVSANGVDIPIYGFPIKEVRFHAADSGGMETYTSSITVDGIERYIPVKLLRSIPSKYDANGIARTKGTSGMWDLVSDKFYGNVANSGTFKAVNLAEGVDYEVHQWLIANIPIGVTMMRLFINQSSSVNYTMNITTSSNSIPLFRTAINGNKEDYVYFNSHSKLYVWNYISNTNESVNTIYSNNRLYDIELTPSEFIINSVSATKYGDAYTIVWHNNSAESTAGVTSTSKITVDGIERYIPVKLLKSIPSKYDANGIARQAGECGMYDTVNDVFYGNVASSGTFSVSDDS